MPKNETWWNPYRFVPVRENMTTNQPYTDELFKGKSGFVKCDLTNYSLLFIGGGNAGPGQFIKRELKPVLPGSSIKGMLRSLAEVVGGGCFVTNRDHFCINPENLCVTCRMFGMLHRGEVHKGQVSPGDGLFQDERPDWKPVSLIQGQPKKSHASFYKNPATGEYAQNMMKMYFHQPSRKTDVFPIPAALQERKVDKQMLQPGHKFEFTVFFENLRDMELNLLLYILALEEEIEVTLNPEKQAPIRLRGPMLHKLGNAKAQGPGSCKICINELAFHPSADKRFLSLKKSQWQSMKGEELKQEIQYRTKEYQQGTDDSPTMQYLRKMMVWDPSDERVFQYPSYNWFKTDGNQSIELKNI